MNIEINSADILNLIFITSFGFNNMDKIKALIGASVLLFTTASKAVVIESTINEVFSDQSTAYLYSSINNADNANVLLTNSLAEVSHGDHIPYARARGVISVANNGGDTFAQASVYSEAQYSYAATLGMLDGTDVTGSQLVDISYLLSTRMNLEGLAFTNAVTDARLTIRTSSGATILENRTNHADLVDSYLYDWSYGETLLFTSIARAGFNLTTQAVDGIATGIVEAYADPELRILSGQDDFGLTGFTLSAYTENSPLVSNAIIDHRQTNSVPEPSLIALMGTGLIGLGFARRRINK